MRGWIFCLTIALVTAGCSETDTPYEAAVRNEQPVYCYRTLAGVDCYDRPEFRDERQLINHFGPPPREYERPEPTAPARLDPPPEVDWYCRVQEPDACPLTSAAEPNDAAEPKIGADAAKPEERAAASEPEDDMEDPLSPFDSEALP